MKGRRLNKNFFFSLLITLFGSVIFLLYFKDQEQSKTLSSVNPLPLKKRIIKSNSQWKKILSNEQFKILREKGTESPFTGSLLDNKKEGVYLCAACEHKLFSSKSKYDSGTGWPSFYEPISKVSIYEKTDYSYGMVRKEILCARCEGHLGHIFPDGPRPTGLRYCVNSISLKFHEKSN